MKFLIAITDKADAPVVASAMSTAGFHSTVTDSFGGFLQKENAIILAAIDDSKISAALKIIKDNTSERIVDVPSNVLLGNFKLPPKIKIGRAVAFTVDVDQFFKL